LIDWLKGSLAAADNDPKAASLLEGVLARFVDAGLARNEIDLRLQLAGIYASQQKSGDASAMLLLALKRARAKGEQAAVMAIRERMAELDVAEGIDEETGKVVDQSADAVMGGYLLRERLGGGSFGSVYRAFDLERGREIALKRLEIERVYDAASRDKYLDSVRLELEGAKKARHPALLDVYAIGRDARGNAYLAEELVRGQTLRALIEARTVTQPKRVASYLAQVADGLAALHACGVVHRDLKPENIMVRNDGSIVIIDFGLAYVPGLKLRAGLSGLGSEPYMPPEQKRGDTPTVGFDTFALGVIAYEWLKGEQPQPAHADLKSLASAAFHHEPRDLDELVAALLQPSAKLRFSDTARIAALLHRFAQ
jgi:serine/threonine protein kinase